MKRTYIVIFIFLFFSLFSYGQQMNSGNYHLNGQNSKFLLDLMAGANFDLISSGSPPGSKLFESKPMIVPLAGFRFTYLFAEKFGGYARFHANFYTTTKSEYNPSGIADIVMDIIKKLVDINVPIITKTHPVFDIGIIYRFELNKWSIHPGMGIGYMTYLPDKESSKSLKEDGVRYNVSYRQHASSIFLNFGLSTRYRLFNSGALFLDVNFQQPIQKSFAELVIHGDQTVHERKVYETSTAGRNINISLGYGFLF
ncbi:MAG: hypothetical protein KA074_00210 [Bacteroidales bacterium]|jgi:hypothetical protein|nr:hypothetical protein [Bacteroidales bacterium]